MNTMLIKDPATRKAINELFAAQAAIEAIKQLPTNASLSDVIKVINLVTNSRKRT